MKRLTGLFGLVMFGLTLITTLSTSVYAINVAYFGIAESMVRPNGYVTSVNVSVKGGWVNTSAIELDITINSINQVPQFRGHQIVPISETTLVVYSDFRDVAEVRVDWVDAYTGPQHEDETYTVCVTVLTQGKAFGEEACTTFTYP